MRYVLRLQAADGSVYPGMDPLLAEVTFSFKVECPSDFDCKEACTCEPAVFDEPEIDYLAKDFASFRQLMLDRMALVLPEWTERNAADVCITLVELLAYVGDYLSYRQDAVATEAYLGTALHRSSVRRHARLLDYGVHDGCNARVWVQVGVQQVEATDSTTGIPLPEHTQLLTRLPGVPPVLVQGTRAYDDALAQGPPEFFETLHAATLFPQHDALDFYTWGQRDCCLPACLTALGVNRMARPTGRESFLQDGLPQATGALEVGGDHRFELLHHAQPPLHFRHDPRLLGEGWERNVYGLDKWLCSGLAALRLGSHHEAPLFECVENRADTALAGKRHRGAQPHRR